MDLSLIRSFRPWYFLAVGFLMSLPAWADLATTFYFFAHYFVADANPYSQWLLTNWGLAGFTVVAVLADMVGIIFGLFLWRFIRNEFAMVQWPTFAVQLFALGVGWIFRWPVVFHNLHIEGFL